MKFIMYYALLVTCLLFPMFGNAEPQPKLVCDEPVYQFGHVAQTAVITHIFIIRNEGATTFVAGMPRVGCGCTRATINKRMIGPGETAELTAVFNAARRMGEQRKSIYLPAADSDLPGLKFYMQGFVETPGESR